MDHQNEFVSPVENGLERSHFVIVRILQWCSSIDKDIINDWGVIMVVYRMVRVKVMLKGILPTSLLYQKLVSQWER